MTEKQLPLIYLAGGLCTVFSMNWIGRWADRSGKLRVFVLMSVGVSTDDAPGAPAFVSPASGPDLPICTFQHHT